MSFQDDRRERIPGYVRGSMSAIRRNELLPFEALGKMELIELVPKKYAYAADPFVLYDPDGRILYQWPNDYTPGFIEVAEVCRQFC